MPRFSVALALLLCAIFVAGPAVSQPPAKAPPKTQPKLEPVAETRLLMLGMADANFRGLERLLQQKPGDVEAWTFARGQAILIAETANLLMMRPPKSTGQSVWFDRAAELRTSAKQLARTVAAQNYDQSRAGLLSLANSCNRCHQSFRVPVQITPFAEKLDIPVSPP